MKRAVILSISVPSKRGLLVAGNRHANYRCGLFINSADCTAMLSERPAIDVNNGADDVDIGAMLDSGLEDEAF